MYSIKEIPQKPPKIPKLPIDFLSSHEHKNSVSIKKLRLCDQKRSITYGNAWNCPDDPTCVKCQKRSIKRHNSMLNEFEKEKQKRSIEYQKFDKNQPIIIVSLNKGYEKLFRNFLCSLETNNLKNILKNMYVLPCEKSAVQLLDSLKNVRYSKANNWMNNFTINEKFKGTNIGHHYLINALTFVVMNEMIQEGFSVLLMDADIIFRKSPLPYLQSLMETPEFTNIDFVCQHTGRNDERSPCNTGFVFFRPTERIKTLTQTLRETIALRPQRSDQLWFNTIIKNIWFHNLNYNFFNSEMFYKRGSHSKHLDSQKVLYHAVGPNKEKKFKSYNDWFLNNKCSYYKNMTDIV